MKKVLIIEDDPIVAHIYRTRLEKEGYVIETCADGQSGFYRIHEFHPDGVLLDLMLPKMNGVEILKKIRAQSQFAQVPIIVFTNAYVPNMIQEAFSAGASQVFNKATLTPRQILDSLHLLLNGNGEPGTILQIPDGGALGPTPLAHKPMTDPLGQFGEPSFHAPVSKQGYGAAVNFFSPTSTPVPPRSPSTPRIDSEDSVFEADLRESFIAATPETLGSLRKLLQELTKAPDEKARCPHVLELYRRIHALTGSAGIAGFDNIAQMTAALEVLLKELSEKPKNINASTLRTVAHSIDFIGDLFKVTGTNSEDPPPANILVVDDEILSRRAITYALEKANLKSINVEDPMVALKLATENSYDLIFLDVQMPGMDGFELCTKIRGLPGNKATPIIFVTSLTDFKSRAKSSLSGGTDLIAKPFMFIELTVKALTHVLRSRLIPRKQAA
jgi:DNA-binding response OmpR family regulator